MDITDLGTAIRRSWWLVALVAVVCVVAAAGYTARVKPTYASHTQLFVAAQTPRTDLQDTYQGGLFTTGRVQSYARIASSPIVTQPVIEELGLRDTPTELGKRITTVAPPETVLIDITVEDRTADGAQRTAQSVARHFTAAVQGLERPERKRRGAPTVRLSISLPATHPTGAISPRTTINLVAGLLLGLVLGLLAAVLRTRVDRRVADPTQLATLPPHVVLGTLPTDPSTDLAPAVGLREVDPRRAEALRRLRTNLRFLDPDHPPRTIVVTSATPGEGKTSVAVGLAMAMADAGANVVLVEGDLRTPRLAAYLGLSPSAGVAGHLIGSTPVDELLEDGWPAGLGSGRLRVLPAGAVPPNPSELLGSRRMRELLTTLRTYAEVVIVDAPALLPVTDAAILASQADGVLIVARMGRVTQPELGRALQSLRHVHARVLGYVANGTRRKDAAFVPGPPTRDPSTPHRGAPSSNGAARTPSETW